MKTIIFLLFLLTASVEAQNWAARMASTLPPSDPYITNGGPTNWAVEWSPIGTNLSVPPSLPTFIWVGDNQARSNFTFTRYPAYSNWYASTIVPQQVAERSNATFSISQNISTLANLYQSNSVFLGLVQTNQAAVTTLTLSNQTVTISRMLNQIRPLLIDIYKGQ